MLCARERTRFYGNENLKRAAKLTRTVVVFCVKSRVSHQIFFLICHVHSTLCSVKLVNI